MATFTIQFTVADEHMDRIRYALRKHFGQVTEAVTQEVIDPETGLPVIDPETGLPVVNNTTVTRDLTGDELLAKVREMSINNVKSIVMTVEAEEAAKLARDSVTAVIVE